MDQQQRIAVSLLALRLGVFLVMLMWTLDKFINPEHAGAVFANFYGQQGVGSALLMLLAGAELVLILGFVAGLWKRVTYGAVLLLHTGSTLSTFALYLNPWSNLLFFAAWPMLAACVALYLLRDSDTLLTWKLGSASGNTAMDNSI